MIEIASVSKAYGDTLVVDGVSLSFDKTGITSIIGPNGAGKSSLLSLISRLLPMSSGSVHVDGLDITRAPGEVLAKKLSILRQDNPIQTRLTVQELVSFGRFPHSKGRLTQLDKQHVERALEYMHLTELAGRFLDELSGGQRQRAFVAMVLCQDTQYVLLDEPLNNLDMRHSALMMQELRRASRELGKAIVIVIHDINFASCYSDQIIAMKAGKIAARGTPDEIIRKDILHSIYDFDIEVHELNGQRISVYYR